MINRVIFRFTICVCLLSSCTANIRIPVLVPAAISVPAKIQTLALVNRYKPEKGQKFLNVMEGILTGEGIRQDRRGADVSLASLSASLSNSVRFKTVSPGFELYGSGTGMLPEPLDERTVKDLCATNRAEGLVTIESFDSDSRLVYGQYMRKTKNKANQEIQVPVHTAQVTLTVTTGWRMYDGFSGQLIDEYRMVKPIVFNGEGATQILATANLPNRDAIIQRIGDVMGNAYAVRISPTWINVNREWYKRAKKNPEMETAKSLMFANNFEDARDQYLTASRNPDPKIAGKAFYNLAIVMEAVGELEQAISFCDEAIKKGNKKAIQYRRILQGRLANAKRVAEQLRGE